MTFQLPSIASEPLEPGSHETTAPVSASVYFSSARGCIDVSGIPPVVVGNVLIALLTALFTNAVEVVSIRKEE